MCASCSAQVKQQASSEERNLHAKLSAFGEPPAHCHIKGGALETKLAALREQLDAKQSDLRKLETEVETRKTALQEAARAFETERS